MDSEIVPMRSFEQDLSEMRDEILVRATDELRRLGDRSRDARTLPEDRARKVREWLRRLDRKTLPVARIAELVDLTPERVYQIDQEYKEIT
jgi:hypothetical protein